MTSLNNTNFMTTNNKRVASSKAVSSQANDASIVSTVPTVIPTADRPAQAEPIRPQLFGIAPDVKLTSLSIGIRQVTMKKVKTFDKDGKADGGHLITESVWERSVDFTSKASLSVATCLHNFGKKMQANADMVLRLKDAGFTHTQAFSVTKPFTLTVTANGEQVFNSDVVQSAMFTRINLVGKAGARVEQAVRILAEYASK